MSRARRVALVAPAKLNLGLRVVGRRADGYHELESVFVPLDLADAVELEVRPEAGADGAVSLALARGEAPGADAVPESAENLACRAARAFCAALDAPPALHIRLDKRIPSGAGLGGGSSDAGAVLRGLAKLFPEGPSGAELERLALSLGADVPFFLAPRPAFVAGVGERVTPLPGWPALGVLLAHPGAPLATGAVYAAFDRGDGALTPPRADSTIRRLRALRGSTSARLVGVLRAEGWLRNDLEAPACRLAPAIAELREEVEATGARATGMTGSGPAVFGLFPDAEAARDAARRLRRRDGDRTRTTWVATTLASPREPS